MRGWRWLALILALGGFLPAVAAAGEELVLLNWPDYFDPELLQQYEQQRGIKVREVYFETDEVRDELLAQSRNAQGTPYDLILITAERVDSYVRQGWLQSIAAEKIPNLRHVEEKWRETHLAVGSHAVPIFWGSLGIASRSEVGTKVSRWSQLLQPEAPWRQRIMMIKDSADLYRITLKSLGYSMNTTDEEALKRAEGVLLQQKPFVKHYGYTPLTRESGLVKGSLWLTMLYNGDVLKLREFEPSIAFEVPEEGTLLWVDTLAILAGSAKSEAAHAFIDYLHEPENAVRMARFAHYATVNRAARALLSREELADPIVYPPEAVLANSEFSRPFPPKVTKRMKEFISRLTRKESGRNTPDRSLPGS